MMTNYENYVREYLHENNPETDSLLERARASLDTSEACAGVIDIFNSELDGNYSERLDGLGGYLEKNGSHKTILILTDKWNDPVFRMNYAGTFINYANRYNIVFMFLLVTDFGVSRIPFLSWDRRKIYNRGQWNVEWGARYAGKERFGKLLEKLDCGHLTYVEEYWQADNNSLSTGRFEFDFLRQEFYLDKFDSVSGISDGKRGKIPAGAVKNFLEAVSDCCELPDSEYFEKNNTDKGPVRHRAEMFYLVYGRGTAV